MHADQGPPCRSDADADVLADYVLALLRHDGDADTVRELCEAEIPDFLKEDSAIFVRDVFDALRYQSYLGKAAPPRGMAYMPVPRSSKLSSDDVRMTGATVEIPNAARKRSYAERDDGLPYGALHGDVYERSFKYPRRGHISRHDMHDGRGAFMNRVMSPQSRVLPVSHWPMVSNAPSGAAFSGQNDPMTGHFTAQAMGLGMPSWTPPVTLHTSRPRCHDYDIRGFCSRGNACQFEHGQNSIYLSPEVQLDEYDPTRAALASGGRGRGGLNSNGHAANGRWNFTRPGVSATPQGTAVRPSRRGGRAEFSSDRPRFDKSNTTILVENIPDEKFDEDEIRGFFSGFGQIISLTMQAYKRLAIVKYDSWDAANAAYTSPKVIFDNRFVKVYWYSNPESLPQPPPIARNKPMAKTSNSNLSKPSITSEVDLDEIADRQQQAQKAHEEKAKRRHEMELARKALEERQAAQAEDKQKLLDQIAAKTKVSQNAPSQETHFVKPLSQTEALKAQLAALEAEARSLGLDPSLDADKVWASGARMRGRGAYRGRANYIPRGQRGAYRGRGGYPSTATAAYKIDNRTKSVALKGVDFREPERDEGLKQYLLVGFMTSSRWCSIIDFLGYWRIHICRHHRRKGCDNFQGSLCGREIRAKQQ